MTRNICSRKPRLRTGSRLEAMDTVTLLLGKVVKYGSRRDDEERLCFEKQQDETSRVADRG